MDSLMVVGFAQHTVDSFLPGIDPVAGALLVGILVSLVLTAFRLLGIVWLRVANKSGTWWTANRDAINPILAVLLGLLGTGTPIGAFLGLAGHGILKGGGKLLGHAAVVSGLARAKGRAVGTILGVGLSLAVLASTGHAAESVLRLQVDEGVGQAKAPDSPRDSFLSRVAFSGGGGFKRQFAPGPNELVGFLGVQAGYLWSDHLNPRVRLTRDLREGAYWEAEVSLWGVW